MWILTDIGLGESEGEGATAVPALAGGSEDDEPGAHRLVYIDIGAFGLRQRVGWRLGRINGHIPLQGHAHAGQTRRSGEYWTQETGRHHPIAAPEIVCLLRPCGRAAIAIRLSSACRGSRGGGGGGGGGATTATAVELTEEILEIMDTLIGGMDAVSIALEDLVVAGIDIVEVPQIDGLLLAAEGERNTLAGDNGLMALVGGWIGMPFALIALQPNVLHIGTRPTTKILHLKDNKMVIFSRFLEERLYSPGRRDCP